MNCQAAARLYIRANGTVPCNCDTGETTQLFRPRLDEMTFVLTHTWNRSRKYTAREQIESLPVFQVFDGTRRTFSNVNLETDNVAHWDVIGETPRDRRFKT